MSIAFAVFNIEQRLIKRRPIVVLAMIECDHAEERLARIDRIFDNSSVSPRLLKPLLRNSLMSWHMPRRRWT
jgi:hypothetical protein